MLVIIGYALVGMILGGILGFVSGGFLSQFYFPLAPAHDPIGAIWAGIGGFLGAVVGFFVVGFFVGGFLAFPKSVR